MTHWAVRGNTAEVTTKGNFSDRGQRKGGVLSTVNSLGLSEKLGQLQMLSIPFASSFLPGTAFHAPRTSLLRPRGSSGLTTLLKVNDQHDATSQGNENQGECPSLHASLLPSGLKF